MPTAYTAIPDSDIDPESPGTAQLFTRVRDNPIAITEGSTGAPRIVGNAAMRGSEYAAMSGLTAADTYDLLDASVDITTGTYPLTALNNATTQSTSLVIGYEFTCSRISGTIRIKCTHVSSDASYSSTMTWYKNGVQIGTWTTVTTPAVRTLDVTIAVGDVITIKHSIGNAAVVSTLSGLSVTASNCFVQRKLLIRRDNNVA